MSLTALPTNVQIEIASHLIVTSDRPMNNLYSQRATCSSMRSICGDLAVGQRLALDRFRSGRMGADPVIYYALLASLTQVGNPDACFLTWIQTIFMEKQSLQPCLDDLSRNANGGHNLAAYLVTLLLYRHNGSVGNDDTVRRYMNRVEGEEELQVVVVQRLGG